MMTKVMDQKMIDQAKVFANTVQNSLIKALKKEQKEDIWDLHTSNQKELLQCSNKTNRPLRQLMIQQ
jgi:dsDNA-binding SOS-regulon protein